MMSLFLIVTSSQSTDSCSDDCNGVNIALATVMAIAIIGLVISIVINVFVIRKLKQLRCVVTSIHSIVDCLLQI